MRLAIRNSIVALMVTVAAAPATRESGKTFKLGKYVKGTAAEIRQTLQGPVDEFTEKTKDAKQRVAEYEAKIAAARDDALPRARATAKYRELAASAKQAEAELDDARRSGTTRQRLDTGSRLNRLRAAMETTPSRAAPMWPAPRPGWRRNVRACSAASSR